MKHTTFEDELRDIRRRAISELKETVKAYGGSIEVQTLPFVLLRASHKLITKIFIKENDLVFVTYFKELKTETMQTKEDFCIEDLLAITEAIPETDDVKDVSGVYPVPVTWVDLDDVGNAGFDTEGMTQDDLNAIQDEMAESYLNYGFNEDLRNACYSYGLKEKED